MSGVEADSAGHYIILIVIGRINKHPCHSGKCVCTKGFFSHLPNMDTHHLILGGDMNCVLSPFLDRSSPKTMAPSKTALAIQLFLNTYEMADTWRFRNPKSRSYSFYSPVHKTYSRIDYLFLDSQLLPLIRECEYQAIVISGHAPLLMTLCIPTTHSSYRPWRFNALLLSDSGFVKFISTEIAE